MSRGPGRNAIAIVARHYRTGGWVRVVIDRGKIASVEPEDGPSDFDEADPWIAPALWDIQTNGRWGASFADGSITPEQVARIVHAHDALGVAKLCPTLITASREAMLHGLRTIHEACESDPSLARRVAGVHLEGPWISAEDGYRGAHPRDHVRDPDWEEFEAFQEAAGGRIVLVTLAPERPGAQAFLRQAAETGVRIALGHTAADAATIQEAIRGGAGLATHVGNGVPTLLPRHPNPIWSLTSRVMFASVIADGRHVDPDALWVLIRAKGPDKTILVSDASPLAGAPEGIYGPWEVRPDGSIVVAGTPYLAGSNLELWKAIPNVMAAAEISLAEAIDSASVWPANLLGSEAPVVAEGEVADLILFRFVPEDPESFQLCATSILGEWTPVEA